VDILDLWRVIHYTSIMDIENVLQENNIDLNNKRIIAAVSGGPDSMCLLYLLNNLKNKYKLKIDVCHVNYKIRGKDADNDEKIVKEFCEKMSIKYHILNCHNLSKRNSENELRDIRYSFFEKIKGDIKADLIAVGHNKDDQVETIVMNFIRGASLKGLGGMEIKARNIIRPLLAIKKKDILKYLKEENILFRIDKTNTETDYHRNKIRNILIPLLEKEYNLNLRSTLIRNSKIIRQLNDFIQNYIKLFLPEICELSKNKIEIDYKKWLLLPDILKYEIIKIAIEKLLGSLTDIGYCHLEEIICMLTNKVTFGKKTMFERLLIEEKYGKIKLRIINKN